MWSGERGLGASLAGSDGTFKTTAVPKGPPPPPFHFNSTNRDLRTGGRYAIFAWSRDADGRVRVSVRQLLSEPARGPRVSCVMTRGLPRSAIYDRQREGRSTARNRRRSDAAFTLHGSRRCTHVARSATGASPLLVRSTRGSGGRPAEQPVARGPAGRGPPCAGARAAARARGVSSRPGRVEQPARGRRAVLGALRSGAASTPSRTCRRSSWARPRSRSAGRAIRCTPCCRCCATCCTTRRPTRRTCSSSPTRDGVLMWIEGHHRVIEATARDALRLRRRLERAGRRDERARDRDRRRPPRADLQRRALQPRSSIRWQCSGAPIHDPATGEILGVVDLTGHLRTAHPHTLSLVSAAAGMAEAYLRHDRPAPRPSSCARRTSSASPARAQPTRARAPVRPRRRRPLPHGWLPAIVARSAAAAPSCTLPGGGVADVEALPGLDGFVLWRRPTARRGAERARPACASSCCGRRPRIVHALTAVARRSRAATRRSSRVLLLAGRGLTSEQLDARGLRRDRQARDAARRDRAGCASSLGGVLQRAAVRLRGARCERPARRRAARRRRPPRRRARARRRRAAAARSTRAAHRRGARAARAGRCSRRSSGPTTRTCSRPGVAAPRARTTSRRPRRCSSLAGAGRRPRRGRARPAAPARSRVRAVAAEPGATAASRPSRPRW